MSTRVDAWLRGIAANPSTPTALLLRLLAPQASAAWAALCRERDLPQGVIDAVVAHPDRRVRAAFARNRWVDPQQRVRLLGDSEWIVRIQLAAGPGRDPVPSPLPQWAIEQMITSGEGEILEELTFSRQIPQQFARTALAHPEAAIRAWACSYWFSLDAEQRAGLLADPDDTVRARAVKQQEQFDPEEMERQLPEQSCHARTHILVNCALSRTVIDSILQGHRRGEVSTIASNFSIPPDVVALLARDSDAEVRRRVASRRDAPPDLLVELARDPDPAVRGVIALQPHLPPGVLDALALDPDIGVRTSASLHPSLTEHQRAEIDYEVRPDVYIGPAVESFIPRDPLWTATCAVSAHPMLRGRAATDPALPLDLMHRLADDSDPTVRLQLAHNHPQAPEHLLLDSFLQGRGHSDRDRHQLTQHPNFPRTGHEPLASHPDPQIRRVAANDPTLPARLIDTLTRDPEPLVRTTAAANPGLPEQRLRELLDQEDLADAAASNPSLPTAWLHELCDRALSGTTAA